MRLSALDRDFIVIGENIHTSRVIMRKGARFVADEGAEAVRYTDSDGEARRLPVPEAVKATQDYDEGRVKHVKVAMDLAMAEGGAQVEQGMRYLRALVSDQERAGAEILDLNVDEISFKREAQKTAMAWLVRTIQEMTELPLSVDSSSVEVIEAGLIVGDPARVRPLLNSASLERPDALDLALAHNARVVVTASGDKGMPDGTTERVANASRMIEAALAKGFAAGDIFVDPLVFPIAVDPQFGLHCLDAITQLRGAFGAEIHITGGISNASFGIPSRKMVNEMFLVLGVEAGLDSGIIDPLIIRPDRVFDLDRTTNPYKLVEEVLLGREDARTFIRAWRKGELALPAGG